MLDINREITANIGVVIRRLRRDKGITQKQLSNELDKVESDVKNFQSLIDSSQDLRNFIKNQ